MLLFSQIIICVVLVAVGAFVSGSETGIYRMSRVKLRLGVEQNKPLFTLLGKTMHDSTALVFSMLIANNLVHYLVTSFVTVILLSSLANPHTAELYTTVILAPVLFVFSEVIPKKHLLPSCRHLNAPFCPPALAGT